MLVTAKTSASDNNPVANPEAVVICGKRASLFLHQK